VHCDPFRDGIWVFQSNSNAPSNTAVRDGDASTVAEAHGVSLLQRDKGIYEPASLGRSKQAISNNTSTPSSSSSPSSSLDSTVRNAQALNARSIQTNSALGIMQEPPTPSPGAKSATGADALTSLKDIHEFFISAVLGSIVYFLCRDCGFVPLNSRTLILTPLKPICRGHFTNKLAQGASAIELATLDISLTSLGTLVVKAHSNLAPGLQTLLNISGSSGLSSKLAPGAALWLAPGGNAAKFYSDTYDKKLSRSLSISQIQAGSLDQRPNGINALSIKSWQSKCLEWLSTKGLNTSALEDGGWLFVQVLGSHSPYFNGEFQGLPILEELAIVPWPALLCFQTSNPGLRYSQTVINSFTGPRDSLSFAEDWFTGKDERANAISKRQKERQAAEILSREQADVEARALQSITYSPAALRRGSNAGAMYPTPPDAPHHPIGATPSFDGNVSTPGNTHPFAPHEPGTVTQTSSGVNDGDAELWGSSGKKDRNNSGMHFNDNDNDNGNIFGDLGGDIFGTDDITDADFSFFDQPDAVHPDEKAESPAVVFLPVSQEVALLRETAFPGVTNLDVLELPDTAMLDVDATEAQQDEVPPPSSGAGIVKNIIDHVEARSSDTIINTDSHLQTSIKLPFNKETVFKRLFQDSLGVVRSSQSSRASLFNRVDFEDTLLSVNEKYSAHGQFNFSTKLKAKQSLNPPELPLTQYLSSRRRMPESGQDLGNLTRILTEKELEAPMNHSEPMDYLMDSDCASQVSEQDDTNHTTDDLALLANLGLKRKWEKEEGDDMTSTFDALAMELEPSASTPQSISGSQLPLLEANPADWSLTTYFTSPEPDIQSNALSDLERIATAQILADQAVSGTLQLPKASATETPFSSSTPFTTRELMSSVTKAAKSCLREIHSCTMRSFLEIQGIPVLNQGLRLPPRPIVNPRGPNSVDALRLNNPFPIPPPQLEVRRSESKLSVLPAAISFWENLGLGPSKGPKDVNAICIYPHFDGVAANADIFLDQMRSVYESSRLGSHDKLITKDLTNGLMHFAVESAQQSKFHHLSALKDVTSRLSRILISAMVEEKNFVVYFIYPTDNGPLLVHICSAFQHLFNLYRKTLSEKRITAANELVLQLIPLDFISSSTSLAVPLPSEYFRLAMEVYDRCVDFTSSSTPAIMLEQPLPKIIDFKLNANPSASLLQENTCLHVAYAQSIDDRWITTTWTDNRGTQQMTASYCLGRKNERISMPFSDVASEIWETTLEFIASKKIHWRIMIARVGVMDPSEMDFWTGLASTEADAQVSLTLITVQTDPSLRLLPASIVLAPNGNSANSVVTPVSTPQAPQSSIVSPGDAATPARENASAATPVDGLVEPDSDARLIDSTDQSWGAVLSHRLNNSNSLMVLNPALISGYLIKRGGVNSDDPPIVMEVNIVYSEVVGNPRTFHDALLREILGYYRGLGTLARVRGLVGSVGDVRPWHIAAAEKAVKALYMLM
jgi:mediator of RNA polymerase II transcription subunit 13